jgi:hypothetical protein
MDFVLPLFIVWALLLVVFGDADTGWPNLGISVVAVTGLYFLGFIPGFPSLGTIFVIVGAYFLLGLGYSLIRWNSFMAKVGKVFREGGKEAVVNAFYIHTIPPRPSVFKGRITNWVMWWPASILNYVLVALTNLADVIGPHLVGIYNKITARHFSG